MRTEAREINKGHFLWNTDLPPKESGSDPDSNGKPSKNFKRVIMNPLVFFKKMTHHFRKGVPNCVISDP